MATTPPMQSATTPSIGGAIGLDWMHGSTVSLVLEGRWEHMLDAPDNPLLMIEDSIQVAGGGRFSLFSDRLQLQPAGIYDVSFNEFALRPEVRWRTSDQLAITAGLLVLGGPTAPATNLTEALTYTGGPIGYFGDNDSAFLTISWIR